MSLFETKTSDNFIFDECVDPRSQDSLNTPFLKKNMAYVVDQQAGNGSYASGEVIIDSQAVSASGNFIDWRNAYIAVPFRVKWDLVFASSGGAITGSTALAKYALALKNMALVDTLKVEANGKTILTATQGLSHLVNVKMLTTLNKSSLEKEGALINYYPDTQGNATDGSLDSYNAANDWGSTSTNGDDVIQANKGLVERQGNFLPSMHTGFLDATGAKNEGMSWDYGTGAFNTGTTSTTPSDISFVAIIKLKHLHDYFDKHPLARGVSYRFTLRFNQAITTCTHGAAQSWAAVPTISTVQTSGTSQPAMFCCGPSSMLARLSWANSVAATSTITSSIDTSANARFSGIRLYVPSYELDPSHQQQLISKAPVIKKNFMDMLTQTTQTYVAANGPINVQVSTSCTNPRALIVIPRWSQTATGNGGQGYFSETSPLACSPSGTDFQLSLTNLQVKMGSNYVLPDRLFYNFQAFSEHLNSIFAQNGNESAAATSGLITKKMFDVNHRYYAFDLSRYPEAMTDLPQMISFEGTNNSAVSVELLCILLYGRSAEFNLAQGSLTITA